MISFIRKGILIIMACVGGVIGGCESKKVPLNKEQFIKSTEPCRCTGE